ncbi:DUF882 domain-containing protein [Oricola thermophila]|uniref:DUF882 domain-containing protein n=2 Tax=Oricola thermophila TaxID=2742145 RepID=A0A6N1VMY4_9HYPH|nr:DUF882 domain-containing protein [Oricola thermophila]
MGLAVAETSPEQLSDVAAAEATPEAATEEDGAIMALAENEAAGTVIADDPDGSVQMSMVAQNDAASPAVAGQPAASGEIVALGDAEGKTARPADPATARIYSANTAPVVVTQQAAVDAEPKRPTGLLALFSGRRSSGTRKAVVPPEPISKQPAVAELWSATDKAATTAAPTPARPVIATASASGMAAGLPGVDKERALGLTDSAENAPDPLQPEEPPVRLASAAGLARLAPNGLQVQHDDVDVSCLKPALVRVLKQVERHYGKDVIVTSGYRSPSRNKKARGAQNSLHMYCSAADIQVEGVGKWELASYLRSMPGRGGVGTYCYTDSVHIDIGPERDWNWRCRRRK